MANRILPLDSSTSIYEQRHTLDGELFTLQFYWNARVARWFCEILDQDGTIIIAARKVTADIPFAVHDMQDGIPQGQLWFFTTDGLGVDPGLLDLGQKVRLAYVTAENSS